ncbi:MAG: hypothetical protein WAO77_14980, partial [Sphingobium sp.]|uniref:hypothetical protein n=1 Tax=Sphingobium sp. TaxID=1912891 RepID=UPI003BAF6BE2
APAAAAGGAGAMSVTHYHHYEIRIDGAGLTEKQLGDLFERKIAEIEAKRAASARSAYRDD